MVSKNTLKNQLFLTKTYSLLQFDECYNLNVRASAFLFINILIGFQCFLFQRFVSFFLNST